tara:strand:- start:58 stop:381 length:324 start_codon:yes stop_codon:yes gene_type:complete
LEQHQEMLMALAGESNAKAWTDNVDAAMEELPALVDALGLAPTSGVPMAGDEEATLRGALTDLPAGSPLAAHAERALETLLHNSRGWSLEQKQRHLQRIVAEASNHS